MHLSIILGTALTFLGFASATNTAFATHFDGIGAPFGGCGVPEHLIGFPNYVALNV